MINSAGWFYWALLSAIFAALTAIFAKVGIQGVDSDLATLIRTAIIIVVLSAFVAYTGQPLGVITQDMAFPRAVRLGNRGIVGLLLPRTQDWRCIQGCASG